MIVLYKSIHLSFYLPHMLFLLSLVPYLGLIVGREDFGPTFDRSVVILEILLNLFDWMRASI